MTLISEITLSEDLLLLKLMHLFFYISELLKIIQA